MGFNGILAECSLMGGIDGITIDAFISQKLVPKLWKGACVVMDNCSIHKGSRIRALIEEVGAKLIYLPTYSPDFNQARKLLARNAPLRRHLNSIQVNGALEAKKYSTSLSLQELIRIWQQQSNQLSIKSLSMIFVTGLLIVVIVLHAY